MADDFDGVRSVYAADINNDGNIDIIGGAQNARTVAWWKNIGKNNFQRIDIGRNGHIESVIAIDLDKDSDIDIISGSNCSGGGELTGALVWWKNDGSENFQASKIGSSCLTNSSSLAVIDIDKDGDNDIVTSDSFSGPILFQNDGNQSFTPKDLSSPKSRPNSINLVDFDSDGDIDIFGTGDYDGYILWWEYLAPGKYNSHIISEGIDVSSIFLVDLDNDGDLDVLGACEGSGIKWWENDGNMNFTMRDIALGYSYAIIAVDIDGDGDFDIASSTDTYGITWWENLRK